MGVTNGTGQYSTGQGVYRQLQGFIHSLIDAERCVERNGEREYVGDKASARVFTIKRIMDRARSVW